MAIPLYLFLQQGPLSLTDQSLALIVDLHASRLRLVTGHQGFVGFRIWVGV